ncbi:hypothetical protein V6N13_107717 [Hibiscus sabdariffa]
MLGTSPMQNYINVYIEEKLRHLVDTNEDEIAWTDEDETVWFDAGDNVDSTIRNAEISRNDETVRNVGNVRIDETDNIDETVRTYETVGNETEFDDENSSEDDDYVVFDHEDSDSPLEDSENDLADSGDEVCVVHVGVGVGVGVGWDIPGFSTAMGENEEMDNESDSDGSNLLHSATVRIDANDCIYPLTYAIVESENTSFWTCVRHLYSNFKNRSGFQGMTLKDALWKAARATYMKEFTDSMIQMRPISKEAFDWLQKKDPAQWSKSHFATHCKSDMLLNNMCESFNKIILEARDKPILTMLEMISCKIMNRFAKKAEEDKKIVGPLCPKIQKKVDALIVQSIRCWLRNADGNRYEVPTGHEDQHVVDLGAYSCTCRKWNLTVIPCVHATIVMIMRGEMPEGR